MQIQQDCKGWLLTCDQHKQKQALTDAYNFLNQYIEQIYNDLVTQTIQKKLKQENKQLTLQTELKQCKKKQNRLLFSIDTKVKCVIFVKINQKYAQIDPVLVVNKMMEDVCIRNKDITRYCHKILPVQRAFKAQHFKMLDVIDQLFEQKSQPGKIHSWALNFKCRNNSKFNYKQILKQCQAIAKKYGHFPDIYYPQWTLSIEITHQLMCISISQKYKQYNEYKLHKKVTKQIRQKKEYYKNEDEQQLEILKSIQEKKIQQKLLTNKQALQNNVIANQVDNQSQKKIINAKNQQKELYRQIIRQKLQKQIIKPHQQDDVDFF